MTSEQSASNCIKYSKSAKGILFIITTDNRSSLKSIF